MKLYRIFEEIKDRLYAAAYDDTKTNILTILQDNWSDVYWLDQFFKKHLQDLQSDIFGNISIEQAIEQTIDEADELFIRLKGNKGANLETLFRPLHNLEYEIRDFQEHKAKGHNHISWLRIYAIHFYDQYVITGGTIKLTRHMQERNHTQLELDKLNMVSMALKLNEAEDMFVCLNI